MVAVGRAVVLCVAIVLVFGLSTRNSLSLDPPLPPDMPPDAHFLPSGYDLARNERTGSWVACRSLDAGVQICRISDAHGTVIYQGAFLPIRQTGGQIESHDGEVMQLNWVNGPAEGSPVPVLSLGDEGMLVPQDDQRPLIDRWQRNPEEWKHLQVVHSK